MDAARLSVGVDVSVLLRASAVLAAADGDADLAGRRVLQALHLGDRLSGDPSMIAQLVALGIRADALRVLERTITLVATSSARPEIEAKLRAFDRGALLTYALQGERAFGFTAFTSILETGGDESFSLPTWAPLVRPVLRYDLAHYLACMSTAIDAAALSPRELRAAVNRTFDPENLPWTAVITPMITPAISGLAEQFAAYEAMTIVPSLALHAVVHGPEAAIEKAAAMVDPFDGRPIHVKRTATEIVFWSIGTDGTDDGGRRPSADARENMAPSDIVASAPLP
jgi:hypothetical protein